MFQQHDFDSRTAAPDLAVLRRELRAIARQLHAALSEPGPLPGLEAARASMARINRSRA